MHLDTTKPRPSGNVYAIRAQGLPGTKIGYAKDVDSRLKCLQTGCPVPLRVVTHIPSEQSVESSLHRLLDHERIMLEWFDGPDTERIVTEMCLTREVVSETPYMNPANVVSHFGARTIDEIVAAGELRRNRPDLRLIDPDRGIAPRASARTPEPKTLWRPGGHEATMASDGDVPWHGRRPRWMAT